MSANDVLWYGVVQGVKNNVLSIYTNFFYEPQTFENRGMGLKALAANWVGV